MSGSLLILVAGPYRSGTDGDPARIQANVDAIGPVRRNARRTCIDRLDRA